MNSSMDKNFIIKICAYPDLFYTVVEDYHSIEGFQFEKVRLLYICFAA